ncbi:CP4-44 prophage; predicted disrupted hemin or colicin receptor [Escherichia coli]|nr:CP4-44 prophage; predicted disrupted hemin or colicin receptor [Escherichia coli]
MDLENKFSYHFLEGLTLTEDGILTQGNEQVYWICPYISRHLLSLNPLQARCRRYSRGER